MTTKDEQVPADSTAKTTDATAKTTDSTAKQADSTAKMTEPTKPAESSAKPIKTSISFAVQTMNNGAKFDVSVRHPTNVELATLGDLRRSVLEVAAKGDPKLVDQVRQRGLLRLIHRGIVFSSDDTDLLKDQPMLWRFPDAAIFALASHIATGSATTTTTTMPAAVTAKPVAAASADKPASTKPPMTTKPTASTDVKSAMSAAAANSLVLGADHDASISNLMAIGYERDAVVAALAAAFNNPDRAVEYLMDPSSMPRSAIGTKPATKPTVASASSTSAAKPSPSASASASSGNKPSSSASSGNKPSSSASSGNKPSPSASSGNKPSSSASSMQVLAAASTPSKESELAAMQRTITADPTLLPALLAALSKADPALKAIIDRYPQAVASVVLPPIATVGLPPIATVGLPPIAAVGLPADDSSKSADDGRTQAIVQQLKDTGFTEAKIRDAVAATKKYDVNDILEWLMIHATG